MRCRKLFLLLCLTGLCGALRADEIHFKNGDRLTGKIQSLADGKLVFKSDVAGTMTVDLSNVQTFSSDAPIKIHLKDGTVLNQKVVGSEPNSFAIEQGEALVSQEFELAAISAINPPKPPVPKWSGDVSIGFTSTHGNTKTDTLTASLNLGKRTEKDRTKISGDYAKSEQEDPDTGEDTTTEDWWRLRGKYDYFFTKKLYGFLDGRYEKDAIAQLDRRVLVG
ncbi:MAG: DUF481 domain-containing protein, partial [Planctomycetota bacterium]